MAEPGSARRAGRPTDADSAATRLQLLHAAISCFAARGLARTTLRDVSGKAGLTAGTLYHHFQTKEALYIAAYTWAVEELYAEFEHAIRHHGGVRDRLVAVLRRSLALAERDPQLMDFVLRAWIEHNDDGATFLPIPDAVTRFVDRLADDAVAAGEIAEEQRAQLLSVYRSMLWGIGAISLTGRTHAEAAVEGFIQLVEGTLFAAAQKRRRAV
jgi:AcrR family transcriptional regulator